MDVGVLSRLTLAALWLGASCGPKLEVDASEFEALPAIPGPTVLFAPQEGVLPFPDAAWLTNGTVALPPRCGETPYWSEVREALNQQDGFAAFGLTANVALSAPADLATWQSQVAVFAADAPERPIPLMVTSGSAPRWNRECTQAELGYALHLAPTEPLRSSTTYIGLVRQGLSSQGVAFLPSLAWSLARQAQNPVTKDAEGQLLDHRTPYDASTEAGRRALIEIDALWREAAPVLQFATEKLGMRREELLLAWRWQSQDVFGPLALENPESAAALMPVRRLEAVTSLLVDALGQPLSAHAYLMSALGLTNALCNTLGCGAVGEVLHARLVTQDFQTALPNPLAGEPAVPGPFTDATAPAVQGEKNLTVLLVLPATPAPTGGYPVVVFGHDLRRTKEDALAIAPRMAAAGLALVAIDWVNHGERRVRTSDAAGDLGQSGAGCDGPSAALVHDGAAAHCFAPMLDADLAQSRDNLRQSVLDGIALVGALKACAVQACGPLAVDAQKLGFLGHGLGSVIGTDVLAVEPALTAGVLNAGAGALVDWVSQTDDDALRCGVVEPLIANGMISGSRLGQNTQHVVTGSCLEQRDWPGQPAWWDFASAARWLWDSAEPVNFARRLAGHPVLLQELGHDDLVPRGCTLRLGEALAAGAPQLADIAYSPTPAPSRGVASAGTVWLYYDDVPKRQDFVGNSFDHKSLLLPPKRCRDQATCADGWLGSAQVQVDAVAFLARRLAQGAL
jgi:dienelactone hydrolase